MPVQQVEIYDEMSAAFTEYSLSVIISRALPDVRDGLKPVHRRILYSMYERGLTPDKPHVKSARVVGDVMANYHPHGDMAIYDALVRLAQDFSMGHVLADGHGNFGSPNPSQGAAASRYTEVRLSEFALALLDGIDEGTVDFVPNYDAQRFEPEALPSRLPNLLVNGSQGIAVGMSTSIPPHNLGEVVDAALYLIEHPQATLREILDIVPGPDFPTGGVIVDPGELLEAYRTGKGSITLRGVMHVEPGSRGISSIVVTELPYQSSPEVISDKIRAAVAKGQLTEVKDAQDYSAGSETRFAIVLKQGANPEKVWESLCSLTPLEVQVPINLVALVDGVPRQLTLLELLQYYIDHQRDVIRRRSTRRLQKAHDRLHVLEGLLRCVDMLDQVIATVRASDDRSAARAALMEPPFSLTEVQANHVLDMTLGQLTRLARLDIETETEELRTRVAVLQAMLDDPAILDTYVRSELSEYSEPFRRPRRTALQQGAARRSVSSRTTSSRPAANKTAANSTTASRSTTSRKPSTRAASTGTTSRSKVPPTTQPRSSAPRASSRRSAPAPAPKRRGRPPKAK